MRLCSIASGSSGNCIYVGSDKTHLLVDAGISGKKVEFGLNSLDLTTGDLDGILVTHEHSDHIKGLGVVARKCGVPIYATQGTIRAMTAAIYTAGVLGVPTLSYLPYAFLPIICPICSVICAITGIGVFDTGGKSLRGKMLMKKAE